MARKNSKTNGHRSPKLYKAYWFRGADPIMEEVKGQIQRKIGNRRIEYSDLKEVENDGGASASCLRSWFNKKTQRPQNATVDASLGALGLKRVIMKDTEG